jgi:ATP-dependent protease ClpP protease subunit
MPLASERYLTFYGPIRTPQTNNLRAALCAMVNEGAKKVTILFASDGGSTEDGIALHIYLKSLPLEIIMHAAGWVSSIAIPVFLAADKRLASQHAPFLFHEYSWAHSQATTTTQTTMNEHALLLNGAMAWTQEIVKSRTTLTENEFNSLHLFDRPVLVSCTDAARYGIISGIAEPRIPAGSDPRIVV